MNIVYIAAGGAAGSICRYGLSFYITERITGSFPWGTFSVNMLGSMFIGLLYGLLAINGVLDDKLRMLLFIGFLGGFTTFSSFALENLRLIQDGAYTTAFIYILSSNVTGLAAAFAGYWIGNALK